MTEGRSAVKHSDRGNGSLRVLFVSSEIYPLAKSGGLADVSAALPMALAALGAEMQLLLPGYPKALEAAANKSVLLELKDFMGTGMTRLIAANTPDTGLPVWLVDCPILFQRPGGLYQDERGADWPDNARRFAHFNHVAARLALGELVPDWHSDVVHANDWHTGLLPVLLDARHGTRPATLFTIHNMAYQGQFPGSVFPSLGLPAEVFTPDGMEFYGGVSFLKAGIRYSDHLTTVSPSYAREILTPEFGCGLDGLLRQRERHLSGILNGVDHRLWDPARDPYLPENFSGRDISGKRACKAALQHELGLAVTPDVPLIVYLSRVTDQKMADVVLESLPAILERDAQFALLGQGDSMLERRFQETAQLYPGRLAARIGYEEPLAHRLHAAADMLLHPSRFEPCGLTQLYALRYGSLPIVRGIGGLADTVVDANERTLRLGTATGFVFRERNAQAMLACIDRALALYRQAVPWRKVQYQAMGQDFGWDVSARDYLGLYQKLAPHAAQVDIAQQVEPPLEGAAD
ncbi:MAG: glycogen synthase GlgA [Stellaceae bacterium]